MDRAKLILELESLGNSEDAVQLGRFFKTGPGQYGDGDSFRGIRVPVLRKLARNCAGLSQVDVEWLLNSAWHEDRMLALLILIGRFSKAGPDEQARIYNFYLSNTRNINNWDLVDVSAEHIVGRYLKDRNRSPLRQLALSPAIWERRMAILSTFHFIKAGQYTDTLDIAEMLLEDREDLIHKAAGWMLREVGKRSMQAEEAFLLRFYRQMPRTMLRYAIERFPGDRRKKYLLGDIEE